jgi:hypothetical protein
MLTKILFAWCLVATMVIFHAGAPTVVLNPVLRLGTQPETRLAQNDPPYN